MGIRYPIPIRRGGLEGFYPSISAEPSGQGRGAVERGIVEPAERQAAQAVVDDPENGGLKSGLCLIAGFHALSCTSPSYYNPYRGVNKNTLSVDMVRLSLTFKGDRGEWLSRKGAQLTDCDEMSAWTSKIRPGGWYELWSFALGGVVCVADLSRLVVTGCGIDATVKPKDRLGRGSM